MCSFKKFEYVEMYSSAICNLNCSYCYIPKVSELKDVNKRIVEDICNGTYIERIKTIAPDLKGLAFWGAEPTITLPEIIEHLDEFLIAFPKLDHFSFSTNLIKDPTVIYEFLKALPDDRKFSAGFQISIDGHKPITDANRGEGTTKKISDNIRLLAFMMNDLKDKNVSVRFPTKITWTMDNVRFFYENLEELDESYNFFSKMQDDLDRINTNKNVKYLINCWGNMELPGNYTKEDGLLVAELFKEVYQRKRIYIPKSQKFVKKKWKTLPLDSFKSMMERALFYSDYLYSKQCMFTCSAGDSQFGISVDGYHPCHRTFTFILEQMRKYEGCDVNFIRSKITVPKETFDVDFPRVSYLVGGFHNFLKMRHNATISSIFEAARVGEILPKYKHYENAYYLALMNTAAYSCHIDNFIQTSSIGISPLSLIRLFGNGALDYLMKEALNDSPYKHEYNNIQ